MISDSHGPKAATLPERETAQQKGEMGHDSGGRYFLARRALDLEQILGIVLEELFFAVTLNSEDSMSSMPLKVYTVLSSPRHTMGHDEHVVAIKNAMEYLE
eukprot:CAMPEP_0194328630 /NCGR_PEP_ID=MMETSP0171-20130528/45534_1 /TAXON_ID=218684 /ORGANISM="Corethron pennatum, Strain L29A3" /LENGTH=100 /DNA_ID=CAMNT_0039089063 /DNA_START=257 /DNA_END=557 /DNA_ORIENTATION=-